MEKITLSPINLLKSKGDISPKSTDEYILLQQKQLQKNMQSPLRKQSNQEYQKRKELKQSDYILLTDKLHSWNKYLMTKFGKINSK